MNSIYLASRINLRTIPSLKGQIAEIKEAHQVIPVLDITEEIDGYLWFHVPGGYIANVDNVFFHADRYARDISQVKDYIIKFLDNSYKATGKAITEIKKGLDKF